jgi:hypothetical protein
LSQSSGTPLTWQDRRSGSRSQNDKKEQSRYKVNNGLTIDNRAFATSIFKSAFEDFRGRRAKSIQPLDAGKKKGPTSGPLEC